MNKILKKLPIKMIDIFVAIIAVVIAYFCVPMFFYGLAPIVAKYKEYMVENNPYRNELNIYFEGNLIRSYPLDLKNKSVFIDKNSKGIDFTIIDLSKNPPQRFKVICTKNKGCKDS